VNENSNILQYIRSFVKNKSPVANIEGIFLLCQKHF